MKGRTKKLNRDKIDRLGYILPRIHPCFLSGPLHESTPCAGLFLFKEGK